MPDFVCAGLGVSDIRDSAILSVTPQRNTTAPKSQKEQSNIPVENAARVPFWTLQGETQDLSCLKYERRLGMSNSGVHNWVAF